MNTKSKKLDHNDQICNQELYLSLGISGSTLSLSLSSDIQFNYKTKLRKFLNLILVSKMVLYQSVTLFNYWNFFLSKKN